MNAPRAGLRSRPGLFFSVERQTMMTAALSSRIAYGLAIGAALIAPAVIHAQSAPERPERPERGVFVTQIGDGSRVDVTQQNSDSLARIAQDGNDNQIDLDQTGTAPHRAQIAQNGDANVIDAKQDGDGSAELTLAQDGNGNTAAVLQREVSAAERTRAAILQRGNGNRLILAQDGSDNSAALNQLGDDNTMTAGQEGSGNRLEWTQNGDNLADLQILQTGNGNLQITQSNTGAQFAPPPGSGG